MDMASTDKVDNYYKFVERERARERESERERERERETERQRDRERESEREKSKAAALLVTISQCAMRTSWLAREFRVECHVLHSQHSNMCLKSCRRFYSKAWIKLQ